MIDITTFQSTEFLVPFLFVFAIIFGALQLAGVFSRATNFAISLALTIFAITNPEFTSLLWSQFGNMTIFFIAMFFLLFFLEAFGLRRGGAKAREKLFVCGVVLFVLLSIGYIFSDMIPNLPVIGRGQNVLLLFSILFVIMIFWSAFQIPPEKKVVMVPK